MQPCNSDAAPAAPAPHQVPPGTPEYRLPASALLVRAGRTEPAQATDLPWMDGSAGTGPLTGFQLTARASMPVACHWETIGQAAGADPAPEELARQLHDRYAGQPDAVSGRLRAITACLAAAGWLAGTPPRLDAAGDANWARVRAGKITVACTVAVLDGVPQPVAIALATWPGGDEPAAGRPADSGQGDSRDASTSQAGPRCHPAEASGSLGRHSVVS